MSHDQKDKWFNWKDRLYQLAVTTKKVKYQYSGSDWVKVTICQLFTSTSSSNHFRKYEVMKKIMKLNSIGEKNNLYFLNQSTG